MKNGNRTGRPDHQTIELTRLRYSHIQTLVIFSIVALILLGGFALILKGNQSGLPIVVGVLGVVTGWLGGKKAGRSGRF
jgi:hypothetical protein